MSDCFSKTHSWNCWGLGQRAPVCLGIDSQGHSAFVIYKGTCLGWFCSGQWFVLVEWLQKTAIREMMEVSSARERTL